MRDIIHGVIGVAIAFILNVMMAQISPSLVILVNVFSLVLIYLAMEKGEIFGAFLGMALGLLQDSFSQGIFGVAGISKCLIGFLAGYVAQKINVTPFLRKFFFISVLIIFELLVWSGLYMVIGSGNLNQNRSLILAQPFLSSLIGCLVFPYVKKIIMKISRGRI